MLMSFSPIEQRVRLHAQLIYHELRLDHAHEHSISDAILIYAAWLEVFLTDHELTYSFKDWVRNEKEKSLFGGENES